MSEEQIINPVPATDAAATQPGGRRFDPAFKRNVAIIGVVAGIGLVVILVIVMGARGKINSSENRVAATKIPSPVVVVGSKPSEMTPADEARLGRVQTLESDAAKNSKDTYIPKELPLKSEVLKAPETQANGPGRGYGYNTGSTASDQNNSQANTERDARIRQGLDLQLAAIIARSEAPPTQSAPPYGGAAATVAAAAASAPTAAASLLDIPGELVKGLTIAGARLVSPLDTDKTDFVSAEITSGPLTGAYLIGKGRMVGEEGVQLIYSRMKFNDVTYSVNVTGLDNQTSSDAMAAEIDRKLLARYVMPVAFTTAQAYLLAVARPAQSVVATSGLSSTIVTPGATAREAVASGLAAGLAKANEAIGQAKPSAYMPIDSSVALLFNDPVLKKAIK